MGSVPRRFRGSLASLIGPRPKPAEPGPKGALEVRRDPAPATHAQLPATPGDQTPGGPPEKSSADKG